MKKEKNTNAKANSKEKTNTSPKTNENTSAKINTKTDTKNKKSKKLRLKKWVWMFFCGLCSITFAICGYNYYKWSMDNKQIEEQIEKLDEITKVEEMPVNEETEEVINPPSEEEDKSKTSDYWKYIKLPLIDVDFTELKAENSDTVAFLKVSGTNINYPVVQTDNNEFYLNHSFNKKQNDAGWVFSDYRNRVDDLKDNTIIYAHGRVNKTMFGSLKNIFESSWYKDTDNFVVHLATPNNSYLFQIFSVYKIPTETYYLTTNFGTKESFKKFIKTLTDRSEYDFNVNVTTDDKLLTLSTCYDKNTKVVLHAKLIKKASSTN